MKQKGHCKPLVKHEFLLVPGWILVFQKFTFGYQLLLAKIYVRRSHYAGHQ